MSPGTGELNRRQPDKLHCRSDWQIEIKSLEFQEASSIDAALKAFSHSIQFRRAATLGGISASTRRKVTFPADAPVSRFIEKTALIYRLKDTNYTLEIARYDEYARKTTQTTRGVTILGQISETPSTSWGASLCGPHWDNLLGQHANLAVGHSADWPPTLDTFFPPQKAMGLTGTGDGDGINNSNDGKPSSGAFWDFICLIKQVAELLGSEQSASAAKEPDRTPAGRSSQTLNESSKSTDASGDQTRSEDRELTGLLDAELGTLF